MESTDRMIEQLKDLVVSRGIEQYEICRMTASRLGVEARQRELDTLKLATDTGIALRIIVDGRLGFSYSTNPDPEALKRIVEFAEAAAGATESDSHYSFKNYPPEAYRRDLDLVDSSLASIGDEERIKRTLELEGITLEYDPRVTQVQRAVISQQDTRMEIINSAGLSCRDRSTLFSASVIAYAEDENDNQVGWDVSFSHFWKDLDIDSAAKGAAKRAVAQLGAKPIASMAAPIVLDNLVSSMFLDTLSDCFDMEQVDKGKSVLAGKSGEQAFASVINIVNDGILPKGAGTFSFDGEGTPRTRAVLVDKGVLQGFLYDNYYASKHETESNGASSRGSVKAPPAIGVSNIFIEPGAVAMSEMEADMEQGMVVTDVMGIHTANRVTGDFSVGASGFLVSKGERVRPVKGVMITGNILDMFSRVIKVGDDLKFMGNVGAPSLMIEQMDISGVNE